MAQSGQRKCLCCGEFFCVDHRNRDRQHYCSAAPCRRASKAASQSAWLTQPKYSGYFSDPVHVQRVQAWRAGAVGRIDVVGQSAAIFEGDHSSSPLRKIASTFFDSTSNAAVSAKARSLRSSSRSSSLMRLRSLRVACGLARASSGSASDAVALDNHFSRSAGYTPCSRHHALLSACDMAAVADPVNGNITWSRIEALLLSIGCRAIQGSGSAVTFEHSGRRASFHRPHPAKEALRYRVLAAREFLEKIGAIT